LAVGWATFSDCVRFSSELFMPNRLSYHDSVSAARSVVRLIDEPTDFRPDSERFKEAARDKRTAYAHPDTDISTL
jgi:hypothetical protein